jgi:TolA-binding protein
MNATHDERTSTNMLLQRTTSQLMNLLRHDRFACPITNKLIIDPVYDLTSNEERIVDRESLNDRSYNDELIPVDDKFVLELQEFKHRWIKQCISVVHELLTNQLLLDEAFMLIGEGIRLNTSHSDVTHLLYLKIQLLNDSKLCSALARMQLIEHLKMKDYIDAKLLTDTILHWSQIMKEEEQKVLFTTYLDYFDSIVQSESEQKLNQSFDIVVNWMMKSTVFTENNDLDCCMSQLGYRHTDTFVMKLILYYPEKISSFEKVLNSNFKFNWNYLDNICSQFVPQLINKKLISDAVNFGLNFYNLRKNELSMNRSLMMLIAMFKCDQDNKTNQHLLDLKYTDDTQKMLIQLLLSTVKENKNTTDKLQSQLTQTTTIINNNRKQIIELQDKLVKQQKMHEEKIQIASSRHQRDIEREQLYCKRAKRDIKQLLQFKQDQDKTIDQMAHQLTVLQKQQLPPRISSTHLNHQKPPSMPSDIWFKSDAFVTYDKAVEHIMSMFN